MAQSSQLKIALVGDIAMLQSPGPNLFRQAWDAADVRIANLEGPIAISPGVPAEKLIRLRLPAESAGWLRGLGVTAVSLANNHMLDWGPSGLNETLAELEKAGIKNAGAGSNAAAAARPAFIEAGGHKIAFLSWASTIPTGFRATPNRPGIAGIRIRSSFHVDGSIADEQPGTPPWVITEPIEEDLQALEAAVRAARAQADLVILALHWGVPPQWSAPFQGPVAEYQAVVAERAVAAGAGVIVGHHCHAPYGIGAVNAVPILYSLGNWIFHPEYLPGALDFTPITVPYKSVHLPENEDSCIAELEVEAAAGGLRVSRVKIHAAHMNDIGEAKAVPEEHGKAIAARLAAFSKQYGGEVRIEGSAIVWARP